jgi:hypothetical protein
MGTHALNAGVPLKRWFGLGASFIAGRHLILCGFVRICYLDNLYYFAFTRFVSNDPRYFLTVQFVKISLSSNPP